MKLSLFRPTFITADFVAVVVLCTFVITASASPQFGRPYLHVLDGAPTALASAATVDGGVASFTASSTLPTPFVNAAPSATPPPDCEEPDPAPDPVNVADPPTTSPPTTTMTLAKTNAAPHRPGFTSAALVWGIVTSAVVFSIVF
ncbi:hypothetical protein PAXINDRAFT_170952 [Paxillus involutus ATCC 200175]|uniref:Uncharacterized protein n=1 Tax=Paxillus involutus ATCC 200175 TaxID=664439 RepID=A0A0C9TR10_PAXIN|nr:hypothetical protein PAXINDRAFT_170952 [Paxillus involutus ATCC 200175]